MRPHQMSVASYARLRRVPHPTLASMAATSKTLSAPREPVARLRAHVLCEEGLLRVIHGSALCTSFLSLAPVPCN